MKRPNVKTSSRAEDVSEEPTYTTEQRKAVLRVLNCDSLYDILELKKNATKSDIESAFRRLSFQVHPDKNKAPDSEEAFKMMGKARDVLTDPQQRKEYDLKKNESQEEVDTANDIDVEEIIRMYFAQRNIPEETVPTFKTGHWKYEPTDKKKYYKVIPVWIQLMPIVVALLLFAAGELFSSGPDFNDVRTREFPNIRYTANLRVSYYVRKDFDMDFQKSIRRLEMAVEEKYISDLKRACYQQKQYNINSSACYRLSEMGY